MMALNRILVGLDLHHGDRLAADEQEPSSQAALVQAVELAISQSAKLTLVASLEISAHAHQLIEDDVPNIYRTVEDFAAAQLARIADSLTARGVSVDFQVVFGHAWEQLTKLAMRGDYNLVVIGTRKRSTAARIFLGSTSHKLARVCPVPVLVVNAESGGPLESVLVASDFSDFAQTVTHRAVGIAQALNARLYVMHALEFPFEAYLQTAGVAETEVTKYRQRLRAEAEDNLNQQLALTDFRTLEKGAVIEVLEGSPDHVIPQEVDDRKIDLLVIGSHGRSGLSSMLLGNTAERILHAVHCSVLVIKPVDFVSPVSADE